MKRVKNNLNADQFLRTGERNTKPSLTIPDQTLSIKELLDRYARGLPIDQGKTPIYHGEEDLPDYRKLDLAEIQDLREATAVRIAEQKADLQEQARAKKYPKKTAPPEGAGGEKSQQTSAAGSNPSKQSGDDK